MRRIAGVQALRALAALLVVIDHAVLRLIEDGHLPAALEAVAYRAGSAGVSLFFVISGFVMALRAGESRGGRAAGSYLLARILRIAPLYWVATLAWAAHLAADGRAPDLGRLLASLLFLPLDQRPVLEIGWTLNFEMYFYVLFAVGLLLPGRWGQGAVAVLLVASGAAGWLGAGGFFADPVLLYFVLGMGVHAVSRRMPVTGEASLLLVLALLALVIVEGSGFRLAMLGLAPLLVLVAARNCYRGGALVALGDASYATYLSHGFFIGPLVLLLGQFPAALPAIVVACQLAGLAVFRWLEAPMLAALRGGNNGKRVPAG